jgi:hypothetical protein
MCIWAVRATITTFVPFGFLFLPTGTQNLPALVVWGGSFGLIYHYLLTH